MPNLPISGLTASASNLVSTDVLPVTQTTGVGPVKMTGLQLAGGLLGSSAFNGGTAITSTPLINQTQTWNAGGVTFTGWRLNVTDTASAAASLPIDLQVGGSGIFQVRKDGRTFLATSSGIYFAGPGASNIGIAASGLSALSFVANSAAYAGLNNNASQKHFTFSSDALAVWSSTTTFNGTPDVFLGRRSAANLRLGAADAAAPVAQTISVQGVASGTTNTAGVNTTFAGSQGTGTGSGGSLIFQVAPAGSSGSSVNALVDAFTINTSRQILAATSSDSAPAFAFSGATQTGLSTRGSVGRLVSAGVGMAEFANNGEFRLGGSGYFSFTNAASVEPGAASDLRLYRDAAGIFAPRGAGTTSPAAMSLYTYGASPPSAPDASMARIYADTSGGKIRLMVAFPSGAAQQIAIEP